MDTTSVNGVVSVTGSEVIFESLESGGPNNDGIYPMTIYKAGKLNGGSLFIDWLGVDDQSIGPGVSLRIPPDIIYMNVITWRLLHQTRYVWFL